MSLCHYILPPPAVEIDPAELAYVRFDARRKGLSEWDGEPMSERDAFLAEFRAIQEERDEWAALKDDIGADLGAALGRIETLTTDAARAMRERDGWREEARIQTEDAASLRRDLAIRRQHERKDVWFWQGDGTDHEESMSASMAVVIRAEDLKGFIAGHAAADKLRTLINEPELDNFLRAVHIEAVHQVDRWGTAHDRAKRPEDWFWLVGYLAGKALHAFKAGDKDKARHHCISASAALYNWHSAIMGVSTSMCPGRSDVAEIVEKAFPGEAA